MEAIARLLDRLLGPRNWAVVEFAGTFFAFHIDYVRPADTVVRRDLREARALRLARKLRHRADNTPRDVI